MISAKLASRPSFSFEPTFDSQFLDLDVYWLWFVRLVLTVLVKIQYRRLQCECATYFRLENKSYLFCFQWTKPFSPHVNITVFYSVRFKSFCQFET